MRRIPILSILALTAMGLVAGDAHAQMGHRHSVQLSGLGASLVGDEFEGIDAGFGFEAQYRLTPGRWSVGVGFQYTQHSARFEGFVEDFTLRHWGAFFEPRLVVDVGSDTMAPYLSGRLSLLREQGDITEPVLDEFGNPVRDPQGNVIPFEIDVTGFGVLANAGGGVLFAMSPRVNLDFGVTVGYGRFNERDIVAVVDFLGLRFEETIDSGRGGNVIFRAGVSVGLGR